MNFLNYTILGLAIQLCGTVVLAFATYTAAVLLLEVAR